MKKRNTARRSSRSKRQNSRKTFSWQAIIVTILCAGALLSTAFFAANLHFSSITYGMRNSELRDRLEDLRVETRRLMLEKEMAMSPGRIKEVAKDHGFREVNIADMPIAPPAKNVEKALESIAPEQKAGEDKLVALNTAADEDVTQRKSRVVNESASEKAERPRAEVVRTRMAVPAKRPNAEKKPDARSKRAEKRDSQTKEKEKNVNERPRLVSVAKLR